MKRSRLTALETRTFGSSTLTPETRTNDADRNKKSSVRNITSISAVSSGQPERGFNRVW